MEKKIIAQDERIIEKIKEVIPKLSPSSKDKMLTVAETMMMLHETKSIDKGTM